MTSTAIQVVGLVGGLCFALAAVPQAIRTIRAGKHLGTPGDVIALIFSGIVLLYVYLYLVNGFDWVITLTYGLEAASWGVLAYYKWISPSNKSPTSGK